MEVPEIYDGTVVIKAAVRAPGERAKVAVFSRERDVDPVGACVGMKGSRVQSIIRELRGEKIDIIEHSDDLVTFAQSALAPAKITRVSVTHQGEVPHLDVIVEDEQLSLAIGKRGQNVRLASELIGARIDIKSETDVKDEVADALARMLQTAMEQVGEAQPAAEPDVASIPGIGAKTAESLQEAGFGTVDALLAATEEQLTELEGVGPKTAQALLAWAQEQGAKRTQAIAESFAAKQPEPRPAAMGDEDFMAALSRAFQESEQLRASAAERSGEAAEEGEAETVPTEGEPEPAKAEEEPGE
jgi:N utilization substance protein A